MRPLQSHILVTRKPESVRGAPASTLRWWLEGREGYEFGASIIVMMTTLAISDELYAEIRRRAAAEGTTDTAFVEAALRSYLGLDALVDRIHDRNRDVSDEDALQLAYRELDAYRAERDAS